MSLMVLILLVKVRLVCHHNWTAHTTVWVTISRRCAEPRRRMRCMRRSGRRRCRRLRRL